MRIAKFFVISLCFLMSEMISAQCTESAYISEIHYDNTGGDTGEGVEVSIPDPQPTDLSLWSIELYNGSNGTMYGSASTLDNATATTVGGFTIYHLSITGLQNGAPDGLALVAPCGVVEFLSYEGSFTATSGSANGMTSTDIGVSEASSSATGQSLQLVGGVWMGSMDNTFGVCNEIDARINEIHYDNTGGDTGEAVEIRIADPQPTNLTDYTLVNYNGSTSSPYGTVLDLSMATVTSSGGFSYYVFTVSGLQNGAPDGIAFVGPCSVLDFVSYEGTITAAAGPAVGLTSVSAGSEPGSTPIGHSLQLLSTGWATPMANTFGMQNEVTPTAPVVNFTAVASSVDEDAGTLTTEICVEAMGLGAGESTSVDVSLIDGTATNGSDISTYSTQTVVLSDGTPEVCISITITDDTEIEDIENLIFDLDTVAGMPSVIGADSLYTLSINDNDSQDCGTIPWAVVSPTSNENAFDNDGEWEDEGSGLWEANGYCGGGCAEPVETWLIYGPLDMTNTAALLLSFTADENFNGDNVIDVLTTSQTETISCPDEAIWATTGTVTADGDYTFDVVGAGGAEAYVGIRYMGDGANGFKRWRLNNFNLVADMCPVLNTVAPVVADAGPDQAQCGAGAVTLAATGMGMWSGGAGSYADATSPTTTYTPTDAEEGSQITLTWTLDNGACTGISDDMILTLFDSPDPEDSEFSYSMTTFCPGQGVFNVMHTTGVDGKYSVTAGDPDGLVLDSLTGELDIVNSLGGNYTVTNTLQGSGNLMISAVIDGPLPGGSPKAVELYAIADITDLSAYGIGYSNNNGPDNQDFALPAMCLSAGDYIYITNNEVDFNSFMDGLTDPIIIVQGIQINGDDVVQLFSNGTLIDAFGESGIDGTGTAWEYLDGWALRNNNTAPNLGVFDVTDFTYSGPNSLDGSTMNSSSGSPLAVGTFATTESGICPNSTFSVNISVEDATEPEITCPADINIELAPGECEAIIEFAFTATDNCDADILSSLLKIDDTGLESGDAFPHGTYELEYSVTDAAGNADSCSFMITILPFQDAVSSLTCNDHVNISIDNNCELTINADMFLEGGSYACYDDFVINILPFGDRNQIIEDVNGVDFDFSNMLGDHTYEVMDAETGVSCWGTFTVEDNIEPTVVGCSDTPINIDCDEVDLYRFDSTVNPPTAANVNDNCLTNLTWSLTNIDFESFGAGGCQTRIERTWSAIYDKKDGTEGTLTCTKIYESLPVDASQIRGPLELVILGCGDETAPELLPFGSRYPRVGNTDLIPGENGVCNLLSTYKDEELDVCAPGCAGNKKIIRTWTVVDWCAAEGGGSGQVIYTFIQIIKAIDEEAPTFSVVDITVGTNPWDCTGNFELPEVEVHDNCDANPTYVGTTGPVQEIVQGGVPTRRFVGAPIGVHEFDVSYTDCCGNIGTRTVTVTVVDNVGPVVSTVQDIVVSLTPGGPNPEDASAKIYWYHVDNQSYDACTDVTVEIRRPAGDPACNNVGSGGHNNNVTFNNDGHSDDNNRDTDGGQFVKFCCADLEAATVDVNGDGTNDEGYVEVIVRAYDALGNYNEAWSFVKVEDNSAPIISGPAAATIYCDWPIEDNFDSRTYTSRGSAAGSNKYVSADGVDFDKTGVATAYSTCGATSIEYVDVIITTEGDGIDQCGAGQFTRIFRAVKTDKNGNAQVRHHFQKITILGRDGDADVTQDINNPAGVGPEDIGPFMVGCDGPSQADLDKYSPVVVGSDPCDVIGRAIEIDTFFFEQGACKKWTVEYKFVNWCDDEEWNDFELVTFMYIDTEKPVMTGCQDTMYAQNDVANCQHALELENSATDNGGCAGPENAWLKWQVYVDLWGDGTIDAYGSSYAFTGSWRKTNSANPFLPSNPNWSSDVWVVNVAATGSGEATDIPALPAELIQGNMSNHKVTWKVTDGCHNFASCSEEFMVVDKKAPTPYCRNLSTAVMNGSDLVELWAIDFNVDSEDNCTDKENLRYTFTDVKPQDDPLYDPTTRSSSRVFNCDDVPGGVYRMYVWDEKDNFDYCEVDLTVVDNDDSCPPVGGKDVSGTIATAGGEVVANVATTIESVLPEYPQTDMTNAVGTYTFDNNAVDYQYTLTAEKNTNLLEGVNTLDLVKIQRHLLGLELLDSPYKVIAADIDNDESIEPGDLLTLRKAILGLSSEFTNNTSWRFVDGSQSNDDLSLVNDYINTGMLTEDMMDENFVAVKVGDVDGTVDGLLANGNIQSRSGNAITLETDNKTVAAGEVVEVTFTSEELNDVYGYQFTMDLQGLEFSGVTAGLLNMTESNVGVLNSAVTVSYNDVKAMNAGTAEGLFTMSFVATEAGDLSEMISSTSSVTRAEAYVGENLETVGVEIAMRGANTAVAQYELLQNEPNPFKTTTTIGYTRPTAGSADFTVLDVTGKVLMSRTVTGVAGYNEVTINKGDINVSGVLYYTLSTGDFTDTKKMIIIE